MLHAILPIGEPHASQTPEKAFHRHQANRCTNHSTPAYHQFVWPEQDRQILRYSRRPTRSNLYRNRLQWLYLHWNSPPRRQNTRRFLPVPYDPSYSPRSWRPFKFHVSQRFRSSGNHRTLACFPSLDCRFQLATACWRKALSLTTQKKDRAFLRPYTRFSEVVLQLAFRSFSGKMLYAPSRRSFHALFINHFNSPNHVFFMHYLYYLSLQYFEVGLKRIKTHLMRSAPGSVRPSASQCRCFSKSARFLSPLQKTNKHFQTYHNLKPLSRTILFLFTINLGTVS